MSAQRILSGGPGPALQPGPTRPLFDVATTRLIEQRHLAALPAHTLMRRAGWSAAQLGHALAPDAQRVWLLCGPGHNGGDGLQAASHFVAWGIETWVTWFEPAQAGTADIQASQRALQAAAQQVGAGRLHWVDEAPPLSPDDLAVDALLGIGARPLTPQSDPRWLQALAQLRQAPCVQLAVDLPSGLSADTGSYPADQLGQPDAIENIGTSALFQGVTGLKHTLSLVSLKPGLFTAAGRDACGQIWFDALGCNLAGDDPVAAWLWQPNPLAPLARRPHSNHKGSHGDVWVIGGAPQMRGAALLAARAALHGGAGRVWVAQFTGPQAAADPAQPELMQLDAAQLPWATQSPHVAVLGCGGGALVREALADALAHAPTAVLDADALNALADTADLRHAAWREACRARRDWGRTVMTPHPLEAARLLSCSTAQVQGNRLSAAQELAERWQAVVVLKGSGSVVAAPGEVPRLIASGNAALATGGTGDALAGWIGAALAGRTLANASAAERLQAVCGVVFAHGAVAEHWAGPGTLTASALAAAAHPV